MAISITSAIYKHEGKIKEIQSNNKDLQENTLTYKGHLFCTTPNCNARLVYVHRTAKASYFRTWQKDDHLHNCIFMFERVENRLGKNTENTLNVEISRSRKKEALNDAYRKSQMTEQDLEEERKRNRDRKKSKKNPKSKGKENSTAVNMVMKDGIQEEEAKTRGHRGPHLLKRNANALTEKDIGKPRLVIGFIKDIEYTEATATITIEKNNSTVYVKFEEVFFANSPEHLGLFHFIEKYMKKNENVILTAIGDVRKPKDNYEVVVYDGEEFRIENMTLITLAARYARKDF
ncbi:hypothetical protein [Priestia aryabhattai]|uniref:hypothetical protein n=1 Tax=Priestia aryabhattai TaxID=412384 RepID=UPI0027E4BFD0|nr:hypothetical protein [Priestia aryabhattai]MCG0050438.1 hypothetical protein [Priestia aryabhattai]